MTMQSTQAKPTVKRHAAHAAPAGVLLRPALTSQWYCAATAAPAVLRKHVKASRSSRVIAAGGIGQLQQPVTSWGKQKAERQRCQAPSLSAGTCDTFDSTVCYTAAATVRPEPPCSSCCSN